MKNSSENGIRMRRTEDQPSVGLILCQDKKRVVAENALRGVRKAIGVSEYQLTRVLPKKLRGALPNIEETLTLEMDINTTPIGRVTISPRSSPRPPSRLGY